MSLCIATLSIMIKNVTLSILSASSILEVLISKERTDKDKDTDGVMHNNANSSKSIPTDI